MELEEQDNSRSKIQNIIWDIFKEVKKVCETNNIRYFMLGGTLLGAIRHKGFIPWDDDIDIGIPRKDYELFLEIVKGLLPNHLKLYTYKNRDSHHYYFARIVDERYFLKRKGSLLERNEEVWVDIFPLDGMPNNPIICGIHKINLMYVRVRYHISCFEKINLKRPNRPLSERIIIKMVQITGWGSNSDTKFWLNKIDETLKKYSYEESNWVINFMGQYKFKEMFPKSYYGEGQLYEFEDTLLIGPKDYNAVLSQMYGEYMIPPVEKDRNTHAVEFDEREGGSISG